MALRPAGRQGPSVRAGVTFSGCRHRWIGQPARDGASLACRLRPPEFGASRQGHGLDPRRHLPDGLRPALRRGAPRPRGDRRRVLDGRAPGDRRRVPPVREGDGARDGRRTGARPGRVPRRASRAARPGLARVPPDDRARRSRRLPELVALGPRRPVAPPRGTRHHRRRVASCTRSPTSPTRTRPRTPPGPARPCRPRPSGSSRRAAASTARSTRGATSSRPRAG